MGDRPRSWDVERPTAPPDHSDLDDGIDPRAPLRVGDRAAWVTCPPRPDLPRRLRGRTVEHLGTVTTVGRVRGKEQLVGLTLDEPVTHDDADALVSVDGLEVVVSRGRVHPRPGR